MTGNIVPQSRLRSGTSRRDRQSVKTRSMSFPALFAKVVLTVTSLAFILLVIILLLVFHERTDILTACAFLLWSLLFNTFLKQLFKKPLFPHLGPGYAFPSGHMHLSSAFYGYIAFIIDNVFVRAGIVILLVFVGWGLVYRRFHDFIDIFGAAVVAIVELFGFRIWREFAGIEKVAAVLLVVCWLQVILMKLISPYEIKDYAWLAAYAMSSLLVSLKVFPDVPIVGFGNQLRCLGWVVGAVVFDYAVFLGLRKKVAVFGRNAALYELHFVFLPVILVGIPSYFGELSAKAME
jgi:undecaprenyl-diphosphatase